MSAKKEVVIHLEVTESRGQVSAATELGGMPICAYAATEEEAIRKAKGAVFRYLGNVVEKGHADVDAIRFRVRD